MKNVTVNLKTKDMKVKIEIENRWSGDIIFELSTEDNTILNTLKEAIKSGVNLRNADLSDANLSGANFSGADLSNTNLSGADLSGVNLSDVNLRYANLSDANLSDVNLSDVNLSGAYLRNANLSGAYLRNANLSGADLSGADLSDVKNIELYIAQTRILPEGDIIGYKKCYNDVIVKLLIPKEAKRSHAFGRKCRAEYAIVVEIIGRDIAYSKHDNNFTYIVGATVNPTLPFSDNWQEECESGIHFFITKIEAENY